MQNEWEGTAWAGSEPMKALSLPDETPIQLLQRMTATSRVAPYRLPTVKQALSVPAIQRSVTLISKTTGSLTVQAFRNTVVMDSVPRLIARPDPFRPPNEFYRDSAYLLATRGETVYCIMSRDQDGLATALVVVPPRELHIEQNNANRMMSTYKWEAAGITSTRWSPVNQAGRFVHITYLQEPGDLHGMGPLQMGGAAASVAVEAQDWAANFYAEGGYPSLVIKHAGELDGTADEDGYNEADRLRNQFMEKAHNTPRVIDQSIESIEALGVDVNAAQALAARDYSTGESARLFGIPGALLEYGVAGASLTYQNLADVWTNFVRGCLAPNYLEPIEQALSDLLSRSTVARFLTSGLDRANPESRWNIYRIAVDVLGPDAAAELARVGEGLAPGNPEVAPIPFAPPAAVPSAVKAASLEMRDVRCPSCKRLLGKTDGRIELPCRHCKTLVAA